jgi:hypothetical protein
LVTPSPRPTPPFTLARGVSCLHCVFDALSRVKRTYSKRRIMFVTARDILTEGVSPLSEFVSLELYGAWKVLHEWICTIHLGAHSRGPFFGAFYVILNHRRVLYPCVCIDPKIDIVAGRVARQEGPDGQAKFVGCITGQSSHTQIILWCDDAMGSGFQPGQFLLHTAEIEKNHFSLI